MTIEEKQYFLNLEPLGYWTIYGGSAIKLKHYDKKYAYITFNRSVHRLKISQSKDDDFIFYLGTRLYFGTCTWVNEK